jgi:hypothetical protein
MILSNIIDDTFNTLSGAKYFSSVDMFSGHWQVELKEEDKEKTANLNLFRCSSNVELNITTSSM